MKSSRPELATNLVIADSSRLNCDLLADCLRRTGQFTVLACTTAFQEAYQLIADHKPDVALVSQVLESDPMAGVKIVGKLKAQEILTRTVIMLDVLDRAVVLNALRTGAKGIFNRKESISHLAKCVNAVRDGHIWVGNTEIEMMVEALATAQPVPIANSKGERLLTDREEQIVTLVADGLTNRDIAERLNLSEHTIKNYLFRIFDKLGVSTRVELILYAVSNRGPRREVA